MLIYSDNFNDPACPVYEIDNGCKATRYIKTLDSEVYSRARFLVFPREFKVSASVDIRTDLSVKLPERLEARSVYLRGSNISGCREIISMQHVVYLPDSCNSIDSLDITVSDELRLRHINTKQLRITFRDIPRTEDLPTSQFTARVNTLPVELREVTADTVTFIQPPGMWLHNVNIVNSCIQELTGLSTDCLNLNLSTCIRKLSGSVQDSLMVSTDSDLSDLRLGNLRCISLLGDAIKRYRVALLPRNEESC